MKKKITLWSALLCAVGAYLVTLAHYYAPERLRPSPWLTHMLPFWACWYMADRGATPPIVQVTCFVGAPNAAVLGVVGALAGWTIGSIRSRFFGSK